MLKDNSTGKIPRIYAVKANSYTDPFISFATYESAYECFKAITKGKDDADFWDYVVPLPCFDGAWVVDSHD